MLETKVECIVFSISKNCIGYLRRLVAYRKTRKDRRNFCPFSNLLGITVHSSTHTPEPKGLGKNVSVADKAEAARIQQKVIAAASKMGGDFLNYDNHIQLYMENRGNLTWSNSQNREKFMSLPKGEQSTIMSYGYPRYMEGGIASLNVKK